ncbi:MAG: hypothetical protein IRZ21_07705 [Thermoleophilaceae bacterium]|nr:hypothetical protein [Thermoleophilaceae bacterium]
MGVLIALVAGLVIWIVGWSITGNGFDFFMITALLVVVAAALRIVNPFIRRMLGHDSYPER